MTTDAAGSSVAPLLPCIVGPTASGKSRLAARLAARVGGEVLSADSVQVYRGFDIGAGKPAPEELALAPHHLIDVACPDQPIEAQVWADRAHELITEVRGRGRVPVICGGTFLWIRALVYGLAQAPAADEQIRQRHRGLAEREGRAHLHRLLAQVDPQSAARLHENDFVRVSRALEVFELSGQKLSDLQREHGFRSPRHSARLIVIDWPRHEYEQRLEQRVRGMVEGGLVQEVEGLIRAGYRDTRAMGAVGYRQVVEAIERGDAHDAAALTAAILQVSRVFARRQRTWLRDEQACRVSPLALEQDDALEALAHELCLLSR